MSLIGSNHDSLQEARKKSLTQEQHIDRTGALVQWRKTGDATKTLLLERAIGCAALPIFLLWSLVLVAMGLAIGLCLAAFQLLSRLFR